MPSIGPTLPPAAAAKRKRTPDDESATPPPKQARNTNEIDLDDSSSDDGYGPSAPKPAATAAPAPAPESKPTIGPSPPSIAASASKNNDEIALDDSDEDEDGYGPSAPGPAPPPKKGEGEGKEAQPQSPSKSSISPTLPPKRTIGPAMPPPDAADTSSDSEDDYGPAPSTSTKPATSVFDQPDSAYNSKSATSSGPPAPQRDDWMLAPPSATPGYSERDPTKIKNRRFASGNKPHAPAPGAAANNPSELSSIWTETAEQKRKRLEDAVLGRAAPAGSDLEAQQQGRGPGGDPSQAAREQEERDRRTAQNVEAARGKSLFEEHKSGRRKARGEGKEQEEEDDPSKRAFDREKDMAVGGKIGTAQRRELVSKAKDFGGRFSKGSYL